MVHTGGCECNAIAYQFDGEPLTCYTCHCTDCQTSSGTAFGLAMVVYLKEVKIIKGKVTTTTVTYNEEKVQRHSCAQCGTSLWFTADKYPELMSIKPGTFSETNWFKPIAHLWTRSAVSWVCFDDSIPKYEKQPDYSELMELWKNREKT